MRSRIALTTTLLCLACLAQEEGAHSGPRSLPALAGEEIRSVAQAVAPADTCVLVHWSSADDFADLGRLIERTLGIPGVLGRDPLGDTTEFVGVRGRDLDRSKPAALAVSLRPVSPFPTFILPFPDEEDATAAAARREGAVTRGCWAALSMIPETGSRGSELPEGLLDGTVSMRVDAATLAKNFKAEIAVAIRMAEARLQQGLSGLRNPDAEGIPPLDDTTPIRSHVAAYSSAVQALISSAETLDCGLSLGEDGRLEFDLVVTARPASTLDTSGETKPSLAAMARHLPRDLPVVMLLRFDWSRHMGMLGGVVDAALEAWPDETRSFCRSLLRSWGGMTEGLCAEWAMGLDITASGLRGVFAVRADDGDAQVRRCLEMLREPSLAETGVCCESLGTREIGDVTAHRVRMTLDREKLLAQLGLASGPGVPAGGVPQAAWNTLLGESGLLLEVAATGDRIVFSLGGAGELLVQALSEQRTPAALEPSLARVGADVNFALCADMRRVMRGLTGIARMVDETVPEIPDGAPLPVSMACGSAGRVHRFNLSLHPEELAALFETRD